MKRMNGTMAGLVLASAALATGGLAMNLWAQQDLSAPADSRPAEAGVEGVPATLPAAPAVDHEGAIAHYKTAKTLYDAQKYGDAQKEVNLALAQDSSLQDAKLLRMRIDARLAEAAGTGVAHPGTPGKTILLSPEQISRIRFAELSDKDTVRGSIPRKALEDFWAEVVLKDDSIPDREKSDAARDRFLNPSNLAAQIMLIRSEKAEKYYDQIKIESDPAALANFRSRVQPFLLQNCATANCHTGNDAHGYRIYGQVPNSATEAQAYTNFYQMSVYSKNHGQMLDRQDPEKSLFLQYSLPKKDAATPHPGNVEVRTKFVNTRDPRFVEMADWIKTLWFPAPDYGINWKPEADTAATQKAPQTKPSGG